MVVYTGDEKSAVGERTPNGPDNLSEKCSSLRVNTARCVIILIILLVMFTPIIVQTFPFPWTTKQVMED